MVHISGHRHFIVLIFLSTPSTPYLKTTDKPLVPVTNDIPSAPDAFPGLYPSYNLPSSPTIVTEFKLELEPVTSIVLHSQWGSSRTTVLLLSTQDGRVIDLTPANNAFYQDKGEQAPPEPIR